MLLWDEFLDIYAPMLTTQSIFLVSQSRHHRFTFDWYRADVGGGTIVPPIRV